MPKKIRSSDQWKKLFVSIYGFSPSENMLKQFVANYGSSVMREVAGMDKPVKDAPKAQKSPARHWNSGIGANPTFQESDATNADVGESG